LFLDELLEFSRSVLESLREPMENGEICISRALRQVRYPARFQLIAAMNPCPCGYYTDKERECCCSAEQVRRYQRRLSGPVLDRIDIHIEVPRLELKNLSYVVEEESSSVIAQRVMMARTWQMQRQYKPNAYLTQSELKEANWLGKEETRFLISSVEKLKLSARAYFRTIKVARTIADVDCCERVSVSHLSEALSWRSSL